MRSVLSPESEPMRGRVKAFSSHASAQDLWHQTELRLVFLDPWVSHPGSMEPQQKEQVSLSSSGCLYGTVPEDQKSLFSDWSASAKGELFLLRPESLLPLAEAVRIIQISSARVKICEHERTYVSYGTSKKLERRRDCSILNVRFSLHLIDRVRRISKWSLIIHHQPTGSEL